MSNERMQGYGGGGGYGGPRRGGGGHGSRQQGGPRGRAQREPDAISAPYNFVPLSKDVVFPGWADAVSFDVPFEDGVCGSFDIEIEATSPIMIKGQNSAQGEVAPFLTDAQGKPYIPGTSLRGMLRNAVEIISFGKLGRVNDHTYGLRDLQNRRTYGQFMSDIVNRKPTPLVNAGWLVRDTVDGEQVWQIEPCHFAKIEYATLQKIAQQQEISGYDPNRRQSSVQKYKAWGKKADQDFQAPVRVEAKSGDVSAKTRIKRVSDYGSVSAGAVQRGRLVFTGQPQNRRHGDKRKKHHDFFFYGRAREPMVVSAEVRKKFEFIHRNAGQQGRDDHQPNEEWGYWIDRDRVPIFFLTNRDGSLRAFGLAMMFRLPYELGVHDVVTNAQADADSTRADLADLIFGYVQSDTLKRNQNKRPDSLRGRVSIGDARALGKCPRADEVKAVLNAPKLTYYPNYIEQRDGQHGGQPESGNRSTVWKTFMKDDKPRARGFKRYVAKSTWEKNPKLPDKASERVMTRFRPLKAGARFRATVRVHNLRPMELGALVWSATFGGNGRARHLIGQAKSLGFGAIKVTLPADGIKLRPNSESQSTNLEDLTKAFEGYMEASLTKLGDGWLRSRQMYEFIAMAVPGAGRKESFLRHMELASREYGNEFVAAKRAGLALPTHGSDKGFKEHQAKSKPTDPKPDELIVGDDCDTIQPNIAGDDAQTDMVKARKKAEPVGARGSSNDAKTRSRGAKSSEPTSRRAAASLHRSAPRDEDLGDEEIFKRAKAKGEHLELAKRWLKEGGPVESSRREIARKWIGKLKAKHRNRHPELVAWLEAGAASYERR